VKYAILFLALIHGAIHLMGFVNGVGLARIQSFSGQTILPLSKSAAQVAAYAWLMAASLFLAAIVAFLLRSNWIPLATVALVLSQLLILLFWSDAKWGTLVNLALGLITFISFSAQQFSSRIGAEVKQLAAHQPPAKEILTLEMIAHLPSPVQKWLQHSGAVGREKIYFVRLKQTGWMRTKPEQQKWSKSVAEQYITVQEPAFIWQVKMNMVPLIPVSGCDRFVQGEGQMQIKLLYLFDMVNQRGAKIDEGALQRYLAEICWLPSAALSPYISWRTVNDSAALATMAINGRRGEVLFQFNQQGDVASCTANRYRGGGPADVKEVWQVNNTKFDRHHGIRLPVESAATWKGKDGDFTWYRLTITDIEYNKPQLYAQSEFR
jgi:hypothetical protein